MPTTGVITSAAQAMPLATASSVSPLNSDAWAGVTTPASIATTIARSARLRSPEIPALRCCGERVGVMSGGALVDQPSCGVPDAACPRRRRGILAAVRAAARLPAQPPARWIRRLPGAASEARFDHHRPDVVVQLVEVVATSAEIVVSPADAPGLVEVVADAGAGIEVGAV